MPEKALILPPLRRTAADAARFARAAHAGQTDKAGRPYIQHPNRVASLLADLAEGCPFWDDTEIDEAEQIAWLHDTVEDTWVTLRHLTEEGFSDKVVCGVALLTKRVAGVPYQRWVDDLAQHGNLPVILVKLADVEDNSDPERLALLPEETRARLLRKYEPAREALKAAARARGWQG